MGKKKSSIPSDMYEAIKDLVDERIRERLKEIGAHVRSIATEIGADGNEELSDAIDRIASAIEDA